MKVLDLTEPHKNRFCKLRFTFTYILYLSYISQWCRISNNDYSFLESGFTPNSTSQYLFVRLRIAPHLYISSWPYSYATWNLQQHPFGGKKCGEFRGGVRVELKLKY